MIGFCGRAQSTLWAVALAAAAWLSAGPVQARPGPEFIYAGTWNNIDAGEGLGFAKGVYAWRFDGETGQAVPLGVVAATVLSADSLAAAPNGRTLYVSEYNGCICTRSWPFPGAPEAGVAAYAIDPATGGLRFLNRMSGHGDMPAEMRVDATGRTLALANYYGGNVVTYRLEADGRLGAVVNDVRHEGRSVHASAGPHPHGLAFSADNRWLYVADQGLDRLYLYAFDAASSRIAPGPVPYVQLPEGSGPRQVSVSPDGKWVFVLTEQGGTLVRFERLADGTLAKRQEVPIVPAGTTPLMGGAQSRVSPDGLFVYFNHRPAELIGGYRIGRGDGVLGEGRFVASSERAVMGETAPAVPFAAKPLWDKVETGARAFAWDSSARWIASANLGENALVLLRRDPATGRIAQTRTALPVPQPSFVLFVRPQ